MRGERNKLPTKKRIALALGIIIISATVLVPFYFSYLDTKEAVDERFAELIATPKPYTFQIPIYMTINGTDQIGWLNDTDMGILLEFTYPNETLIVNEPVFVNATAVIDKVTDKLDHITLVFPNSLVYPITYGDNHLPLQGILNINNGYSIITSGNVTIHNMYLGDETTIIFPQEGDYSPIIRLTFKDNTHKTYYPQHIVIHVYPKEELRRLDTERVSLSASQASLKLSEAVFVLGFVSVFALVVQVLDHSETECKYTKSTPNPQDGNSKPKQDNSNRSTQFKKKYK